MDGSPAKDSPASIRLVICFITNARLDAILRHG
jgi:hypothetical protein